MLRPTVRAPSGALPCAQFSFIQLRPTMHASCGADVEDSLLLNIGCLKVLRSPSGFAQKHVFCCFKLLAVCQPRTTLRIPQAPVM